MKSVHSPTARLSPFQPLNASRSFELVCERVREKLLRGELTPGDKLPPERDLAVQLGVSRNVVREALRSLEIAGVVALKKGVKGGAFIKEGAASSISQALSDLITLKAITLVDLFEARVMILEMVLDHAFRDGQTPDLDPLAAVIDATRVAVEAGNLADRVRCARDFYHAVAEMTGNTAIVFTVDSQTELVQTFLRYRVGDMEPATLMASREGFLAALRDRRLADAKAELHAHLDRVHKSLW